MHPLGATRSVRRADHLLQTPDTHIRAALPGMHRAVAIVHASAALGAGFLQYTAEMSDGAKLGASVGSRFFYVLEGTATLQIDSAINRLEPGGYAFIPDGLAHQITSRSAARLIVFEKPYLSIEGTEAPRWTIGRDDSVQSSALMNDPDVQVQSLLPDEPRFDFAVNLMTFSPGASLSLVEMHVMEHGLTMLDGSGIYRLGEYWYPVTAGDFIWMGPYCLQWFGAIGKEPARYLIYKNWARHPQLETAR